MEKAGKSGRNDAFIGRWKALSRQARGTRLPGTKEARDLAMYRTGFMV